VVKAMLRQQLRVVWSRAGRIEWVVVMVNGFGLGLEQWTGDAVRCSLEEMLAWGSGLLMAGKWILVAW
jgi:hypothetical protein